MARPTRECGMTAGRMVANATNNLDSRVDLMAIRNLPSWLFLELTDSVTLVAPSALTASGHGRLPTQPRHIEAALHIVCGNM